ncbi:MAG: hypothetical protein HY343_06280 [Lentisphaerae bacterium]|nr:hypothetical protein [Lentisphaerota bacterium]
MDLIQRTGNATSKPAGGSLRLIALTPFNKFTLVRLVFFPVALALAGLMAWVSPRPSELRFFSLITLIWFGICLLIDRGVRDYRWADAAGSTVLAAVDAYFLVLCLGLMSGNAALVLQVLALYGILATVWAGIPGAALAALTGATGYATCFGLYKEELLAQLGEGFLAGVIGIGAGLAGTRIVPKLCARAWHGSNETERRGDGAPAKDKRDNAL